MSTESMRWLLATGTAVLAGTAIVLAVNGNWLATVACVTAALIVVVAILRHR